MKKTLKLLTFLCLLGATTPVLAENVYIEKANTAQDSEYSQALYDLTAQAVEAYEDNQLVATEPEASLVLIPKVITLGEAAIVTLNSRNKASGQTASQKLKIRSIDELDIATERLVEALFA